jgi:long-subunit fatty acid transport protein
MATMIKHHRFKGLFSPTLVGVAALIAVASSPHPARSAGFLNAIQSAGSASVSTAGQTAIAEDSTTIYYNPAGTARPARDFTHYRNPVAF